MSALGRKKLALKPRNTLDLSRVDVEKLVTPGNAEHLARLDWEAKISGDLHAMRLLAGAHLRSKTQVHAGVGRERWILQLAVSHTDTVRVSRVDDLSSWVTAARQGLTLARIEALDFGGRRSGSLDKSFSKAEQRLANIETAVKRLLAGSGWIPADLIKDLSFCGDLYLCEALASALFERGDNGWGKVVMAAHVRNLHNQPTVALSMLEEVLGLSCNPGALNSKSGALCDIGDRSVDGRAHYAAAMEATLLSLAVAPNSYAAATGARSFKMGGRPDVQGYCLAMWGASKRFDADGTLPAGHSSLDSFMSQQAALALVTAGRRDLAELQLRRQWTPADWARLTRQHADTGVAAVVGL